MGIAKFADAIGRLPAKDMLKNAKGIAFLSACRIGCIVTVRGAKGAIVVKKSDGAWSSPCAIRMGGVALGADIGVENSDMLIVLNTDAAVRALFEGQLSVGFNGCIAIGPMGRALEGQYNFNFESKDGTTAIFAFSKGLYGGVSLQFTGVQLWPAKNRKHYPELRSKDRVQLEDFTIP